jgi:hypothetical protein
MVLNQRSLWCYARLITTLDACFAWASADVRCTPITDRSLGVFRKSSRPGLALPRSNLCIVHHEPTHSSSNKKSRPAPPSCWKHGVRSPICDAPNGHAHIHTSHATHCRVLLILREKSYPLSSSFIHHAPTKRLGRSRTVSVAYRRRRRRGLLYGLHRRRRLAQRTGRAIGPRWSTPERFH